MENLGNVELLSPREAAQRLDFGVDHILKLCRTGQLPAAKIGRRWRVIWPLAFRKILEEGGLIHDAVETDDG